LKSADIAAAVRTSRRAPSGPSAPAPPPMTVAAPIGTVCTYTPSRLTATLSVSTSRAFFSSSPGLPVPWKDASRLSLSSVSPAAIGTSASGERSS
jgi:hypothetical protein